jgi:hypothetical protein
VITPLPAHLQALITSGKRFPLGIDVGYSAKRKSVGLASPVDVFSFAGLTPSALCLATGQPVVRHVEVTLAAALAALGMLPPALKDLAVVTIDGPLGRAGPPTNKRFVDRECQRGACQNRCVAASVAGGGAALVTATYQIIAALKGTLIPTPIFSPAVPAALGPLIAEVNPTVGMAWLVQQVANCKQIPSRSTPVLQNGRLYRAKSDYYWSIGARATVATVLGCPAVANVLHHEQEASLYALAVATALAQPGLHGSHVFCIGKQSGNDGGVYHLLGPIHASWAAENRRIGLWP